MYGYYFLLKQFNYRYLCLVDVYFIDNELIEFVWLFINIDIVNIINCQRVKYLII